MNILPYQGDNFIFYNNKILLYIKKLLEWMDNKQSNISTINLPTFEDDSLNIEANIYSFILQSMYVKKFFFFLYISYISLYISYFFIYFFREKNFWQHDKNYLKEISEAQFTSNVLYEIFNHILYFFNRNLKVQL